MIEIARTKNEEERAQAKKHGWEYWYDNYQEMLNVSVDGIKEIEKLRAEIKCLRQWLANIEAAATKTGWRDNPPDGRDICDWIRYQAEQITGRDTTQDRPLTVADILPRSTLTIIHVREFQFHVQAGSYSIWERYERIMKTCNESDAVREFLRLTKEYQ